ncbi:hypothetical protein SAMD00019534_032010 [Acytostelium subglobosum LB1]|uniref:hypothetical protein n=1 Tax=Acytostelium subglobosum LB1 TaxID=1410327 RepID=UPI0006449816|nr:hypothetical protein SAMD00019534_032010 [Acytostelium subglobosum LB1]GAM20026.1 hypothetical protein SAMD00019534_032010 [Acytostelium subglobosum LB1]|eukprot:XP_012756788.1 hypothetical protein SAMD00019534_032010 [Acytostelium subglobosum LB1]
MAPINRPTLLCSIIVLLLISISNASHFRYGTLSWVGSTTDDLTFTFTFKAAFRYSFFWQNFAVGDSFDYGYVNVGSSSITTNFVINNVDHAADWMTANMVYTTTFSSYSAQTISYSDCCRISELNNNADQYWNLESTITPVRGKLGQVSAVSSLLPVIPIQMGVTNTFQIPALVTDGSTLAYSLSSSTQMPGSQPPGLSISSTGFVSYVPSQIGVWCAQTLIKSKDTTIPVDFILNVSTTPVTKLPPVFNTPPTPAANSVRTIPSRSESQITIKGTSPQSTSTVSINIGTLPDGMVHVPQVRSGPSSTLILVWTPTASQFGMYIINLGLIDSDGIGMVGGSQYFYINVTSSSCGNGNRTSGGCSCDPGWTGPLCDQCAPNNYGPKCTPMDPCINGIPSNGTWGDGSCVCNQGWSGKSCNITLVQRCVSTKPNTFVSQTFALRQGFNLQPVTSQLYLSKDAAAPAVLSTSITNPYLIPWDLFFVIDTSSSASISTLYSQVQAQFSTFTGSISDLNGRDTTNYALADFQDSTNPSSVFQLRSSLKPSILPDISQLVFTSGAPTANVPYNVLINGIPSITWSNRPEGSVKMVILITDNNLAPTDNTLPQQLQDVLTKYNIQLGVFSFGSSSSYSWLANNYGINCDWKTGSSWFTQLLNNLIVPISYNLRLKVVSDPSGATNNVAPIMISNTTSAVNFTTSFIYSTSLPTINNPVVTLAAPGFGRQLVHIQYNHAPTTSSTSFTVRENVGTATNIQFTIPANDVDNNVLSITFTSIPAKGKIVINGTVPVVVNTVYSLPVDSFTYIPSLYQYGADSAQFSISDGCLSADGTISITISIVPLVPSCSPITLNANQFDTKAITLMGSDINNLPLAITVSSGFGNMAIGSLLAPSGAPINTNTQYSSPTILSFVPLSTARNTNVTGTYLVTNSELLSVQCPFNIILKRNYVPPTLTIPTTQTMTPFSLKSMPFSIQSFETSATVTITAITPMSGTFYDSKNRTITPAMIPYTFSVYNVTDVWAASDVIYYQAINANEVGIQFTIEVTDLGAGKDTKTVTIAVNGPRVNNPPVAKSVAPISMLEDGTSPIFTLDGTDPDQTRYDNVLPVIFASMPGSGSLFYPNGSALVATGNVVPLQLVYKPNTGFFGSDKLIFYVQDSLQAPSNQVTVNITVTHVNHNPSVTAPSINLYGQTGGAQPSTDFPIITNDVDSDLLTVTMVGTLPEFGSFKNSAGNPISVLPSTLPSNDLTYTIPTTVKADFISNYTIQVCDNGSPSLCATATGIITFVYKTIHPPPTCSDLTIETTQIAPISFNLNGTDQDTTVLSVSLNGLESLASLGVVSNANTPISNDQTFSSPATFDFTPLLTTDSDQRSVPFTITNEFGLKVQCSLTLKVNRVAVDPTIDIPDSVSQALDSSKQIPFTVGSLNFNEVLTVEVTDAQPIQGSFLDASNNAITATPYSLGVFNVSATHAAASTITYHAINAIYTGIKFTIKVTDSGGRSVSKTVTITLTGSVVFYPPVANPVDLIIVNENANSSLFQLTGSHPLMPQYTGKLFVTVSDVPRYGEVWSNNGPFTPADESPLSVFYQPFANTFGNDSFHFYVTDEHGSTSALVRVDVKILMVNYPPVIEFNPPVIVSNGACSETPLPVPFNISLTLINPDPSWNISFTKPPQRGHFIYDGVRIDNYPFVFSKLINALQYQPDHELASYTDSYEITACGNICGPINGSIVYNYQYSTPVGAAGVVYTLENHAKDFTLVGTVCEPETVFYQFVVLPYGGVLSVGGVPIESTEANITSSTITFTPKKDVFGVPFETIYYRVFSQHNTVSTSYPIVINIEETVLPVYEGSTHLSTYENVALPITLQVSKVPTAVLTIMSYTHHGQLFLKVNGTHEIEVPASGLVSADALAQFQLRYVPKLNQWGNNYDTFTFVLNEKYQSVLYTIVIDVIQVFQPPVIIPISYTFNGSDVAFNSTNYLSNSIEMYINSTTVVTWNITSLDLPWETLRCNFGSYVSGGRVYHYVDGARGPSIEFGQGIKRSADGLWRIQYEPTPGFSGNGYYTFRVQAYDAKNYTASTLFNVDVLRINIPPYVTLPRTEVLGAVGAPVSIVNVNVTDPDSTSKNSITFTVSLTDSTGALTPNGNLSAPFLSQSACTVLSNKFTCVDRNTALNYYLNVITASFDTVGNYSLVVYVNDLGYNANPKYRNVSMMSDTKSINLAIAAAPGTGGKGSNTVVLSAAIAASAVAAALIALGVWRVLRSRAPPTDTFFGEGAFSEGSVASNPLYEQSRNSMANPMYESPGN